MADQTAPLAAAAKEDLCPGGVLRAGINLANFLLVTGRSSAGEPEGVAPDMAAEVARRLGAEVKYVPFKSPAALADAVDERAWDIGFIGAEPERAEKIAFTDAYVEIPCTYLVPAGSPLKRVGDVDAAGVRVASVAGSAFHLWLTGNLRHAELVPAESMDAALEIFKSGKADALAGLRTRLLADAEAVAVAAGNPPSAVVLDGQFTAVRQAIGVPRNRRGAGAAFLRSFVEEMKASGFVADLINRHGVAAKLAVAPPAASGPEAGSDVAADCPPAKRQRTEGGGGVAEHGPIKVAVLGCGAMGSIYAGLLASAGNEVWGVDVWREHVEAIQKVGLRVEGASGDRTVRINATTDASKVGPSDLVIIATKASGVADAAEVAARLVKEDGVIVTIQNGIGAGERIARHIDVSKVMLGIASNFGASMRGPGHAYHSSMNLICLGEMAGGSTERLDRTVGVWSRAGFKAQACPDIHKMIWQKLVCNCTYSGVCTVTGMNVGAVQDDPAAWRTALACAREADAVARAKGFKLDYDDVKEYVWRFGSTVRDAKPSMLQDHLAKRRGEVDAINGAIPAEAAKVGLTAPVSQTVADLVRARESTF